MPKKKASADDPIFTDDNGEKKSMEETESTENIGDMVSLDGVGTQENSIDAESISSEILDSDFADSSDDILSGAENILRLSETSSEKISGADDVAILEESEATVLMQDSLATEETDNLSPAVLPGSRRQQPAESSILTLEVRGEVQTQQDIDDTVWHEIRNSQISRRPLTGILGKVEQLESGVLIAIVNYKGVRIAIPVSEMMLHLERSSFNSDSEFSIRQAQTLSSMMGAEIDFIVHKAAKDGKARVAVASRKSAMMFLRQRYYINISKSGLPQVHPGRVVEARIITVHEWAVRVEIFGVEFNIGRDYLSWDAIEDIRDEFFVGDTVLVRVTQVIGDTLENLRIFADIRSLTNDNTREKLEAMKTQTNIVGTISDVRKGVYLISLIDGVKALSHICVDSRGRTPGRGDQVMFVVTRIDWDRNMAIGIIARIMRRNL